MTGYAFSGNDDDDPELVQLFNQDQKRLYSTPARHSCPDCGRPNVLTDEMERRGYCCSRCAHAKEFGIDGD